MSLTYFDDKYNELRDKIMRDDILDEAHIKYINEQLDILGESSIKARINEHLDSDKSYDKKQKSIINTFREVDGREKPTMDVFLNDDEQKNLNEKIERVISNKKSYEESGTIKIILENYTHYSPDEEIVGKYINVKSKGRKHIKIEVESVSENDNSKVEINCKYSIKFNNIIIGRYKESIEISFKDVETKIYTFFLDFKKSDKNTYKFKFKNIDELYHLFKKDVDDINNNINYNSAIVSFFNDSTFENYLLQINEYVAFNLYKYLNLNSYDLYDINLFFKILDYPDCNIKLGLEEIMPKGDKNRGKIYKDDVKLNLFKFHRLENFSSNDKFKVNLFNVKGKNIKIVKAENLIPNKIKGFILKDYKFLEFFKNKLEALSTYILIIDFDILKRLFKKLITREEQYASFKILIISEKGYKAFNIYKINIS